MIDFSSIYIVNFFDVKGETSQKEYWKVQLIVMPVTVFLVLGALSGFSMFNFIFRLWIYINLIPQISLNLRRMNSLGMTGGELLTLLIANTVVIFRIIQAILVEISGLFSGNDYTNNQIDKIYAHNKSDLEQQNKDETLDYSLIYPYSLNPNLKSKEFLLIKSYPRVNKTSISFWNSTSKSPELEVITYKIKKPKELSFIRISGQTSNYSINLRTNTKKI